MEQSNLNITLEAIDSTIAEKRECIRRGEMLKRLSKNQDFRELILDYCLDAEAKKLFEILTDPTGASPYSPEEIHLKLGVVSHFKGLIGTESFKGSIEIEAERAPLDIANEELYRLEVTAAADGE